MAFRDKEDPFSGAAFSYKMHSLWQKVNIDKSKKAHNTEMSGTIESWDPLQMLYVLLLFWAITITMRATIFCTHLLYKELELLN